jgi:hypothetical protein
MFTVLRKNQLKDGYYYSGYVLQSMSIIANDQPMIVALWDGKKQCFCMWEYEGYKKCKTTLSYLSDLDNEIEAGFYPVKSTIPKEEHLIE